MSEIPGDHIGKPLVEKEDQDTVVDVDRKYAERLVPDSACVIEVRPSQCLGGREGRKSRSI